MAYIYVITNSLNGKQYVGKTEKINPIDRFQEHLKDAIRFAERPLYRAINKYGKENFIFEILEETDSPEEREVFWIAELGTYGSIGYNATKGGDGSKYLDEAQIISDYAILQNIVETAKKNGCSPTGTKAVLARNGVNVLSSEQVLINEYSKQVDMLNIKTGETLNTFESQMAAARFLIEQGYSKSISIESVANKIGLVCRGKRTTAYGFKWQRSC